MNQPFTLPPDLVRGQDYAQAPANLWHLLKSKYDPIWRRTGGKDTKLAVLDTGYSPHPDLPVPIETKSFIRGESVNDGNGHGTHCCGTALGRNGIGVAPEADLIIGKVLSNSGSGGSDGIADGIRWAVDVGADVISMSLGGGGAYEPTRQAIQYAVEKGVVVNCAAGNAGFNGRNTIGYPGKFMESLCQAAYREDGQIAGFSSGGREVDWACPGQNIISCSHRGQGYVSMSGTSMATPFGSGLLLLILESMRREGHAQPRMTDDWRAFLQKWCKDAGREGEDDRFGSGIPKSSEVIEFLGADDVTAM